MTIEIRELDNVQELSNEEMRQSQGGLYWNFMYQPQRYNWFYRPVLPLNTFAGALNNGWAIRGAAFDSGFNSWMNNFRNS